MRTEPEQAADETLVSKLIVGIVATVCRFPRLALACALVLCGLSLYATTRHMAFLTQRDDLVSPRKDYLERWRQYVAEFGDDDDMVVVVQGDERGSMQAALEALADEVRRQPSLFDRLFYKVDLRALRNRALLFLPAVQIQQIQDNIKSMGLLLEPPVITEWDPLFGWKQLTLTRLLGEAEQRIQISGSDKALHPGDEQLLTQLASICNTAAAVLEDPARYTSPWESVLPQAPDQKDVLAEPQYFFMDEGRLACLLVRPVKEAGSFTSAQKSVEGLRAIVAGTESKFPGLRIGLTGLPVLENDEMVASQHDTHTAGWLALAGVAGLFVVVYRCFRYPLMTVSALLAGTCWAMGWATVTVGHLNILSSTFAVMLIGLGDYGVLWVTRYDQERGAGSDLATALRTTAVTVGPSILTAAATTSLAFFAAMLSDFKAVAELGWIAGSGVLMCALATLTIVPAMLCLLDRRPRVWEKGSDPLPQGVRPLFPNAPAVLSISGRASWLPWLMGRPRWVIGVAVVLTVVMGALAWHVRYDHNLLHLQATELDSVQWEMALIKRTGGATWYAVSSTATPQEALELKARFEKLPVVSRVVTAADMVPLDQERKMEMLRDLQRRLRKLPERGTVIPHARPSPEEIKSHVARLRDALEGLATAGSPVVARLQASARKLQTQLAATARPEAIRRLQVLEQGLTRDLAADLHRLREVSTPQAIHLEELPASFRERYVGRTGKWKLQVFGKESLWEFGPLRHFTQQISSVDPEATGKPFSTLAGLVAMTSGFRSAGLYALVAMVLVLLLDFRKLGHTLIALAPLAMGVIASLGIMALCGVPLNPANMIAFPLILGVGADNGTHVLHDFLCQRHRQHYALSSAMGRGVMVKALTTIIGFATLLISHHRGLASLGLVLTIGVTCCMMTALVFLPALLRVTSRRRPVDAATWGRRLAA
jgi:hopanoid biosynthesis associated RND transporter like protein HpnN